MTRYCVYRDDGSATYMSWPIAVIPISAGQTSYSYTDPKIGWGVVRTYVVRAMDDALNESGDKFSLEVSSDDQPPSEEFGLTIKVTGNDAVVIVSSLVDGSVFDIDGQRVVDDKSVSHPRQVKPEAGSHIQEPRLLGLSGDSSVR